MAGMFQNNKSLTNLTGLEGWNTSKVTNFKGIFDGCRQLTSISGISGWNVSEGTWTPPTN